MHTYVQHYISSVRVCVCVCVCVLAHRPGVFEYLVIYAPRADVIRSFVRPFECTLRRPVFSRWCYAMRACDWPAASPTARAFFRFRRYKFAAARTYEIAFRILPSGNNAFAWSPNVVYVCDKIGEQIIVCPVEIGLNAAYAVLRVQKPERGLVRFARHAVRRG